MEGHEGRQSRRCRRLCAVWPVQKDLQSDCCLILFDLDHFKQINDTQGHQVGDKLLSATVAAIYEVVNADTLVARMGGEEFAILMPRCDVIHGACVAEQCRKAIEGVRVTHVKSNLTVSASFGVSDTSQVGYNIDNLLAAADLALYKSKQNGRNQVNRYFVEWGALDNVTNLLIVRPWPVINA